MEDASGDAAGSSRHTRTRSAEGAARSAALERLRVIRDASARGTGIQCLRATRDGSARAAALERLRGIRDGSDRATAIERLRAIRDGRARGAAAVQVKIDAPIYDTVAEKDYAALVARRRKEAGEFIIDDDGRRTRTRGTAAVARSAALERLRAIKEGRARAVDAVQVKVDAPIYDTVMEEDYAALVARRRKEAGEFIIDDVGPGYAESPTMVARRIGPTALSPPSTRYPTGVDDDARVDEQWQGPMLVYGSLRRADG